MIKNAGYTIIEETKVLDTKFVLEKNESNPAQYVTWEWDEKGGYYWGHYFGNYVDALKDLYQRTLDEINLLKDYIREVK